MPGTTLLIDVGNTNTKIGLAVDGAVSAAYSLPTDRETTADSWGLRVLDVFRAAGTDPASIEAWVVSSVVPPVDPLLARAAERFCGCSALFVPADVPIPLENRYLQPQEVGADRLVTAFAARDLYDEDSLIVVDYGTATTFDCVHGAAYLGGLICPGVHSSVVALAGRTAKLPRITLEIDSPDIHVGRSTFESLNQGFVFGFAAMTEGILARLRATLPGPVRTVATGGFAARIKAVCPDLDEVRPDLLLEGLLKAYRGRS
jgi:type III pantothenate kinase